MCDSAPKLKDGGILIVEQDMVRVSDLSKSIKVYSIPATRIAEELGKRMVLNSVMVGFFTAVTQLLEPDAVRKAVADSVPPSFPRTEPEGLRKGLEYGDTASTTTPNPSDAELEAQYAPGVGSVCRNQLRACHPRRSDDLLSLDYALQILQSWLLYSSTLAVARFITAKSTRKSLISHAALRSSIAQIMKTQAFALLRFPSKRC